MERRSKEKIINLEIYTDGSLKRSGQNMKFGGWAFVAVRDNKKIYEAAGNEYGSTNQRMELEAIRNALQFASSHRRSNEKVIIYSDSAYLVNCYQQDWYIKWEQNGWQNVQHKDVANRDLWEQIIPFFDNFWYYFIKVPGHAGNYWNEECDIIAQDMANRLKLSSRRNK